MVEWLKRKAVDPALAHITGFIILPNVGDECRKNENYFI